MSHRRLVVAAAAALALAAPAGAAAVTPPSQDPFYGVPAGIDGLADGTVIDARRVTATLFSVPLRATAWQVRFKTRDTTGAASAYITTVLVPRKAWTGSGPRPVLSYQMPQDGVSLHCSPSYVLTAGLAAPGNTTPDPSEIVQALDRGWTVVVPDYEGPDSAWLGADGQSRGVLDSLRAARAFSPAGIDPKAPIALWGYSGGAVASSTAAQLQPSHAPELRLAGVALGGNNATIRGGLQAFDGSPFGGAIVIGFIGLDRAYPEYRLASALNADGRARVAQSQDDCIAEAVVRHPFFRASAALADPAALDGPPWTEVFRRASPLTYPGTPQAPVYDYHATGDELAPIGPDRELVAQWCGEGVRVQHVEDPGEHFSEVAVGTPGALAWLAARFAGEPAPSTCGAQPQRSATDCAVRAAVTHAALGRRRVQVRGTATATCGGALPAVTVAVARRSGSRCRFLGRDGRLGQARRCARPAGLRATGRARWRLTLPARLPAGRYAIAVWTGRAPAALTAARTVRVR